MLFRTRARLSAIKTLLAAQTLAGSNIKSQATPLTLGDAPAINVRNQVEEKGDGSPAGAPRYKMTCDLFIEAIVEAAGFEDCSNDLDTLSEQITEALLTNAAWLIELGFETSPSLVRNTQIDGSSDRHIGREHIVLSFTYTDDYPPVLPYPFKGATLKVDAGRPFDASGPYPAQRGFPPPAAPPRPHGPDGRLELEQTITFPQD